MIGRVWSRLVDRVAARLADTAWLREMRKREVQAWRSVPRSERKNPISEAAFPTSRKHGRRHV